MSNDKPHITIIGAGPTGLEAALAAREKDLPFTLYESAATVAGYVRADRTKRHWLTRRCR